MTDRKPSSLSFPDWVEHQIRAAEADGAFENLPGSGKPIAGIERAQDELQWVANWLRREGGDVTSVLPPALALAKQAEDLPVRLLVERTEPAARQVVDDLNARISRAHAAPQVGPPLRVKLVDADAAIAQWRATRAEIVARRTAETRAPDPVPPRASWWRRTLRRTAR